MHCKHSAPTAQHFYSLVGEELIGVWRGLLPKPCCVADGLSPGKYRAGWCHLFRSQRMGARLWGSGAGNRELGRKAPLAGRWWSAPWYWHLWRDFPTPRQWEQRMKTLIKKWRLTHLLFNLWPRGQHETYLLWQSFMHGRSHMLQSESEGRGEKKNVHKKYSVLSQQTWEARNVQPLATLSSSYLHNGFPNVLKWLLHKFTDTVDLPSGYDKVLRLIRLQHQPHGLQKDKQNQIQCTCKWPPWYMILHYCILDLKITTRTHTYPKLGKLAPSLHSGY